YTLLSYRGLSLCIHSSVQHYIYSIIWPDYRTTLLPELSPLIEINNNDYVNFRLHVFIHVKIQSTLHFFLKKDNREDKNYCSVSEHPPKMLKNFGIIIGENTLNQIYCMRSEEHTSELQSRFDLVCRLLLEQKKIHS